MPESEEAGPPAPAATGEAGSTAGAGSAGQPAPGAGPAARPQPAAAWADELSNRVVEGVGWVRARTTVPIVRVLRAAVYGLVALVALVTGIFFGLLALVRMWDVYVPVHPVGRRVWLGYVVLGSALMASGVVVLARRGLARRRS
ncbi:MAG TPA: hypothetical protein VME46_09370 [Acidimicrobiales bacterium]|nr:hypothetical protein [Acidimicrobiales bacterium]